MLLYAQSMIVGFIYRIPYQIDIKYIPGAKNCIDSNPVYIFIILSMYYMVYDVRYDFIRQSSDTWW